MKATASLLFGVGLFAVASAAAGVAFEAALLPPDAGGEAGAAVALGDGWAAVGAPFATVGGNAEQGAVHLYRQNEAGVWCCATSLVAAAGAAYDRFGQALGACSNRLAVGAWGDDQRGADAGASHLYETDGTNWFWLAKLTASDGAAGHLFGCAVALDGDRLAVGARKVPSGSKTAVGAVYVFERAVNGQWTQRQKLQASDGVSYDYFGCAVALDGDELLAGANDNDDLGSKSGSAYLFGYDREGTATWTQRALLLASDGASFDLLGSAAALRGGVAAVGAPGVAAAAGAVYLYARDAGGSNAWGQVAKVLAAGAPAGAGFGSSVALAGERLAVGAPDAAAAGPLASGSAFLYAPSEEGTDWKQEQQLVAEQPAEAARFGTSVAASASWLAVGSPGCTNAGAHAGAALLYREEEARPVMTGLTVATHAVLVSWAGSAGCTQILERASRLSAPDWTPVLTNPPSGDGQGDYTDTGGPARFYRLLEIRP